MYLRSVACLLQASWWQCLATQRARAVRMRLQDTLKQCDAGLGVRVALGLAVGFGLRAAHLREAAAAEAVLAASLVGDRHGGFRLGIVGRILGKRLRQG